MNKGEKKGQLEKKERILKKINREKEKISYRLNKKGKRREKQERKKRGGNLRKKWKKKKE